MMAHLTEIQLDELHELLIEEKKELESYLADQSDNGDSLTESVSELSAYDNHPADIGTETFERGRDLAINDHIDDKLGQIDSALNQIKDDEYGKCVICGEVIPFERLQAIPYTPFCIEHAQEDQSEFDEERRPVEEQVMTPPPGGAGENRQRNAGRFDDADAWETVESYGNSDSPAMSPDREVKDYDDISSDKVDRNGMVEELEAFTGNDIAGKRRHVQQTKVYRDYVDRGEDQQLPEPDEPSKK